MMYILNLILDSIFPPTKHALLLRNYSKDIMSDFYRPGRYLGVNYLSDYHIPLVQAAVAACKFEHNYYAADLLAEMLKIYLHKIPFKKTLLLPIPLSQKRERERGYNQVAEVLLRQKRLPYEFEINTRILKRTRDTKAQTSLLRTDRLENIKQAFSVKTNFDFTGFERVIICDDVVTTGATLNEARATLAPHLSPETELVCLAWAH